MQNIFKSEQNAIQITTVSNENRAGRKLVSKLKEDWRKSRLTDISDTA